MVTYNDLKSGSTCWLFPEQLIAAIVWTSSEQWISNKAQVNFVIGHLHDSVIWLQLPESFTLLFSVAD